MGGGNIFSMKKKDLQIKDIQELITLKDTNK
jgi:hypothetical protein